MNNCEDRFVYGRANFLTFTTEITGCLKAEIIPVEPDPDNAGVGNYYGKNSMEPYRAGAGELAARR